MYKVLGSVLVLVAVSCALSFSATESPLVEAVSRYERSVQCDGPNEEFACRNRQLYCQTHPRYEEDRLARDGGEPPCTEDCYCKRGHVRDARGVCIPVGSCIITSRPRNSYELVASPLTVTYNKGHVHVQW